MTVCLYIAQYTADTFLSQSQPWHDLSDRTEVYLPRSRKIAGFEAGESGVVSVYNSLECKISCGNSKTSYVLDTEDVFHRVCGTGAGAGKGRGSVGKSFIATKTAKSDIKFHAWLDEKVAAMPPPEDEAQKKAKAEAEAIPDFATAAAAAMMTGLGPNEEEAEEEEEEEEEADEEHHDRDDTHGGGERNVAADETMEDAEGE